MGEIFAVEWRMIGAFQLTKFQPCGEAERQRLKIGLENSESLNFFEISIDASTIKASPIFAQLYGPLAEFKEVLETNFFSLWVTEEESLILRQVLKNNFLA